MSKLIVIDHPRKTSIEHYNDVANCPLAASLNAGYAVAMGTESGWKTKHLDFLTQPELPQIMAHKTIQHNPDVIAIHWVYSWGDENHIFDYLKQLRKSGYEGVICTFGLFPTFCAEDLMQKASELDCIILGEFEQTLSELLCSLSASEERTDLTTIPGLLLRQRDKTERTGLTGAIYRTKRREVIENLDQLPFSADIGKTAQLSYINIAASRGCYGQCSFCFINPYYGCQKWRERSVDNVIDELTSKMKGRNSQFVYFVDPNFFGPGNKGQQRAIEMAQRLKPLNISFGLEARVNDIHDHTIQALADAGLESVFLGIESGCDTVLKRMNKHITVDQSEQAIKILRNAGVKISVGFIMFEPDSTIEEVENNFKFLKRNNLLDHHDLTSNMLYHNQIVLKGTPGYESLKQIDRLIYNRQTPYEAKFSYKHPEVGHINRAMGELTNEYYRQMDKLWRTRGFSEIEQFEQCHEASPTQIPHKAINELLINSFTLFIEQIKHNTESDLSQQTSASIESMKKLF